MCHLPATSKEHAPPICFFPEAKDVGGSKDYHLNLLTVPSCDLQYNSEKSTDDLYLLFIITSHYENNPTAQTHFSAKVMRTVRNTPSMYNFIKDNFPIKTVNGSPSLAYTVDRDRFDGELDHIAEPYIISTSSRN